MDPVSRPAPSPAIASTHAVPYHDVGQEILTRMQEDAPWYADWLVSRFTHVLHGDILEAGCGIGTITERLSRFGVVTGVDGDADCVAATRVRNPNGRAVLGNLETGAFDLDPTARFDACVSVNVHEHLRDDVAATDALADRLRVGGHLVVLAPAHPWLFTNVDRALGHHRRYTVDRLRRLAAHAGLEVTEMRRLNWLGAIGWGVTGHLLRRRTIERGDLGAFARLAPLALRADELFAWPIGLSLMMIARKTHEHRNVSR